MSTFACEFDFVPSRELAEDGAFDGRLVGQAAHRAQALALAERTDTTPPRIVGAYRFPPVYGHIVEVHTTTKWATATGAVSCQR